MLGQAVGGQEPEVTQTWSLLLRGDMASWLQIWCLTQGNKSHPLLVGLGPSAMP